MACAWWAIIPCMKRTSASVKIAPSGMWTGGRPMSFADIPGIPGMGFWARAGAPGRQKATASNAAAVARHASGFIEVRSPAIEKATSIVTECGVLDERPLEPPPASLQLDQRIQVLGAHSREFVRADVPLRPQTRELARQRRAAPRIERGIGACRRTVAFTKQLDHAAGRHRIREIDRARRHRDGADAARVRLEAC